MGFLIWARTLQTLSSSCLSSHQGQHPPTRDIVPRAPRSESSPATQMTQGWGPSSLPHARQPWEHMSSHPAPLRSTQSSGSPVPDTLWVTGSHHRGIQGGPSTQGSGQNREGLKWAGISGCTPSLPVPRALCHPPRPRLPPTLADSSAAAPLHPQGQGDGAQESAQDEAEDHGQGPSLQGR